MLPSAGKTASASQLLDFGAEPSRPASLLCTLRTHQSSGEWQHSLPAYSLALAARDSHPLDFIKWFPLLHYWLLRFHAYPSATYRKSHSTVFTNVTLLHCAQNLPQYQFARQLHQTVEGASSHHWCLLLHWTAKVEIEALSSSQFRSPAASSPAGGASRGHRGVGALFDWQSCGP